jgi:hypothetical protein
MNEFVVTCFADIDESTSITEMFSQIGSGPINDAYLAVSEILANYNGGDYVRDIGGSNAILFRDLESSFNFACQLQQFYQAQPNYSKPPITPIIRLYLGVVGKPKNDAFGPGVNAASGIGRKAEPGTIWLDKELMQAIYRAWGEAKARSFLCIEEEVNLTAITNSLKPELVSFNWHRYIKNFPDKSLSAIVYKHLQEASVIISNLTLNDFGNQPSIIWPVKPRDNVNAIHCGQLEVMRLLAMLGFQVNVLIADCGAVNVPRVYSENFKEMIEKFANTRGIRNIKYTFMSDLFTPLCPGCDEFHRHFQYVISQLTFQTLLHINNKEYAENVKDAISRAATLDFLHPALTISAVLHLSKQIGRKCIIVAGYDEKIQWEEALSSIPYTRGQFGVLFNPILNNKDGTYQGRQTKNWPLYFSWQQMLPDMDKYNLSSWLIRLHLFLYHFPAPSVKIGDIWLSPKDWQNDPEIEKRINKEALAKDVFDKILTLKDCAPREIEFQRVNLDAGKKTSLIVFPDSTSISIGKNKAKESRTKLKWDAFICHASEDKNKFVRQLATDLSSKGLKIWYDELTLKVGDSLRQSIEKGLSKSRYGIVVLSPAFFAKKWSQDELNGLNIKERDGKKVILPVWLNVDEKYIAKYSPMLADRLAAKASEGLEKVVSDLLQAINQSE